VKYSRLAVQRQPARFVADKQKRLLAATAVRIALQQQQQQQ